MATTMAGMEAHLSLEKGGSAYGGNGGNGGSGGNGGNANGRNG